MLVPNKIRNLEDVSAETLKRRLDKWLKTILDEPKTDNVCGSIKEQYCEMKDTQ